VREKILSNERYGVVEINKDGTVAAYNSNALAILGNLCRLNPGEELKGLSVTDLSGSGKSVYYDAAVPEKFFSSIDGIKHIDNIFYKDTESVIVRFVTDNEMLVPLLNMIKLSSSLYVEFDNNMNIIFANDSFIKSAGADRSQLYGANISIITEQKVTGK